MSNKGFTLIELLAVIVMLCLFVVFASISVTNVVKDSKNNLHKSQIKLIEKAARLWASSNINKLPVDNECIYITIGDLKNLGLLDSNTKDPKTNLEFDDNIKIKISSTKTTINSGLNYEFDSKDVSSCQGIPKCNLTLDENNNKVADIGDMITCSTESFRVIENDGETISMLAKYNLDVGYIYDSSTGTKVTIEKLAGIQSENAIGKKYNLTSYYGVDAFSKTPYWEDENVSENPFVYGNYSNNVIYPYIKAYETYLINKGVTSVTGTLISLEKLLELGCKEYDMCSDENEWLYTTSYWTGTASDEVNIWILEEGGYLVDDSYYEYNYGIRPVINISVSELN